MLAFSLSIDDLPPVNLVWLPVPISPPIPILTMQKSLKGSYFDDAFLFLCITKDDSKMEAIMFMLLRMHSRSAAFIEGEINKVSRPLFSNVIFSAGKSSHCYAIWHHTKPCSHYNSTEMVPLGVCGRCGRLQWNLFSWKWWTWDYFR